MFDQPGRASRLFISLAALLALAGVAFWLIVPGQSETTPSPPDNAMRLEADPIPLSIIDAQGRSKVEFVIEVADTEQKRSRGLMFRTDLGEDRAMLFVFPDTAQRYFWMQNTPTSLDIIYAEEDGDIVSIASFTTPYSTQPIPSRIPAKYALETLAGLAERHGLSVGDRLSHPLIGSSAN